jgi:hypothetical protein
MLRRHAKLYLHKQRNCCAAVIYWILTFVLSMNIYQRLLMDVAAVVDRACSPTLARPISLPASI